MSKEIDLSRKTVTEDKDGNALITGKISTEGAIVDAKDLTTKEHVDNAIAQASKGLASEAYVNNKLANLQLVKITQAEYDVLETKDPNTLYLIVE